MFLFIKEGDSELKVKHLLMDFLGKKKSYIIWKIKSCKYIP